MHILPKCILIFFILSLFQTAHARLPSPPTRQETETLVQRLRGQAAGRTRPETRQRLAESPPTIDPPGIRQNPSSFLRIFLIE